MPESPVPRALPVVDVEPPTRGLDRRADRARDRRLTAAGLAGAIAFLVAGLGALALPPETRLDTWLPLHLVLAGGAGTAIAAMLPFFAAALTVAPPAPAVIRGTAIAAVALGALLAVLGRVSGGTAGSWVAVIGATAYVVGIILVLLAAAAAFRGATGPGRRATEVAYLVALVEVAVGVSLAALLLVANPDVSGAWVSLKPAHAWLNLFGFVTLVIAGSLAHFAPTVAGSRIGGRRWAPVAVGALAIAAPLVAAGYALGSDVAVRLGTVTEAVGATALVAHGWESHRRRFAWTTDPGWHAFTSGSLVAAPAWLLVAAVIATSRVAAFGAGPESWRLAELLAPLVAGFVVQVLLGALSHLLPAIGPGSPERHAVERRILGREGPLRLAAWNVGVAIATVGLVADLGAVTAAGAAILVTGLAATLVLLAVCLLGRR